MSNAVSVLLVLACVAIVLYDIRKRQVGVGTIRVIASLLVIAAVVIYRVLT